LKGPIPLAWLSAAVRLRGKAATAVALAIWFEAGRKRSMCIRLTTPILARFCVKRKAKYSGLRALERAGLVRVERVPHQNPEVSILEMEPINDR
jgi:hypothetical protein